MEELKTEIRVGDKIIIDERVGAGKFLERRKAQCVVVKKYPHFCVVDRGNYRESFMWSELVTDGKRFEIRRADEWGKD